MIKNNKQNFMIRIIIAHVFFSLLSILSFGQNKEVKHPIDIRNEKCHSIDSNQTTYGMIQCETIAEQEWDAEMNKYYKLLMAKLTPEEKDSLKMAQRQWVLFRDKELGFSWTMYDNMEGTMWRVVGAGRAKEIVKERALALKVYYDMLTTD